MKGECKKDSPDPVLAEITKFSFFNNRGINSSWTFVGDVISNSNYYYYYFFQLSLWFNRGKKEKERKIEKERVCDGKKKKTEKCEVIVLTLIV